MQNLDQIRAAAALPAAAAEKTTKQAVSKLPAMIIANGLLATAAFADEHKNESDPKRKEMKNAMDAVAGHLANPVHGMAILNGCKDCRTLIERLTRAPATSLDLQRATTEALAFLAYVKRFATKEEKEA